VLPCPRSPPFSSRRRSLGAAASQRCVFPGREEGDFLSACPYSEHAQLRTVRQDYRPVRPEWAEGATQLVKSHQPLHHHRAAGRGERPLCLSCCGGKRRVPTVHHQLQGVLPDGGPHGAEVAAGQAQRVRAGSKRHRGEARAHRPLRVPSPPPPLRSRPRTHWSKL